MSAIESVALLVIDVQAGFDDVAYWGPRNNPHDLLVAKTVNSAFHGSPDLDAWLRQHGIAELVVCGITTNHCCETTARLGGNLGYEVRFVLDATHTFDRIGPDGARMTADELARATATNLHGEFATVVATTDLLSTLNRR